MSGTAAGRRRGMSMVEGIPAALVLVVLGGVLACGGSGDERSEPFGERPGT